MGEARSPATWLQEAGREWVQTTCSRPATAGGDAVPESLPPNPFPQQSHEFLPDSTYEIAMSRV